MSITEVKGCCPLDGQDGCSWIAQVEDGRVVKVPGSKDHSFTRGILCAKVNDCETKTSAPDRLLNPLRRIGGKGEGGFERISRDRALDEIAGRFGEIVASHGAEALMPLHDTGSPPGCCSAARRCASSTRRAPAGCTAASGRGAETRCDGDRDRSAAHADGTKVRRAHRDPAWNGRDPRRRHCQASARRRDGGPRLRPCCRNAGRSLPGGDRGLDASMARPNPAPFVRVRDRSRRATASSSSRA